MSKHTPGPWGAYCMGSEGWMVRPKHGDVRHKGKRLAFINWLSWEEDTANAHLIAAAPELLEVCQNLLGWADSLSCKILPPQKLLNMCIKAIEKAEGRGGMTDG